MVDSVAGDEQVAAIVERRSRVQKPLRTKKEQKGIVQRPYPQMVDGGIEPLAFPGGDSTLLHASHGICRGPSD